MQRASQRVEAHGLIKTSFRVKRGTYGAASVVFLDLALVSIVSSAPP
jgi:hypothetical protein